MKQAATRIEDKEYELFQKTAASVGTTTADALRIFIYSFNDHHGFPYPVQSRRMQTGHPNPASSFPLRTYPCS